MAKKIGILTLSSSDNCGSLLQAFALQKYILDNFDVEAEIIDYDYDSSRQMYDVFPKGIIKHPKSLFYRIINIRKLLRQKKDYREFRKTRLKMSSVKYKSIDDLRGVSEKYDLVICGSDQVWNVKMGDYDHAFLLNWCHSRKISYAASLGKCTLTDRYLPEQLKEIFASFHDISVREQHGKMQLEELTGRKIPVLLDPTLLLTRSDWESLVGEPLIKGDYIFYYSWAYKEDSLNRIVEKYASVYGLPVYIINASRWTRKKPRKYGFELYEHSGPRTFLNLMKYAKKVFVSSFHGIIFASIFEKDFYYLDEHKNNSLDPRLDAILNLIVQRERVVRKYEDIGSDLPIDYSKDKPIFNKMLIDSKNYLEKNIR